MFNKKSGAVFKWNIGDTLKDKVSGLTGIVMVRAEYATGCHHYGLAQRGLKQDGTLHEWEWLDETRLQFVEAETVSFREPGEPTRSGAFPSGPGK